jgi:hypothetical protein
MRFFVVGTGRCGSRLLRDILNLHQSIYVPTESHWIPVMHEFHGSTSNPFEAYVDIIERTCFVEGTRTIDVMLEDVGCTKDAFYEAVRERLGDPACVDVVAVNEAIYRFLAELKRKPMFGDKTPDYGFYMSLLQRLWPRSRFIHMVRDGRDVARSMSRHPGFRRMVSLGVNNWCPISFNGYYRIGEVVEPRASVSRGESLEAYTHLWESRLRRIRDEAKRLRQGTYLEAAYEDLLADPKQQISQLAAFLEIPMTRGWLVAAADIVRSPACDPDRAAMRHP